MKCGSPKCDNEFTPIQSSQEYCSPNCRKYAHKKRKKLNLKENAPVYDAKKIMCARYGCEELFVPKSVNNRFCSDFCGARARKERKLLEEFDDIDPAVLRAAENELVREKDRQMGILQRRLLKEETRTAVVLQQVNEFLKEKPRFTPPATFVTRPSGKGRETQMHALIHDTQAGKWENGIGTEVLLNDYLPTIAEKIMRIAEVQRAEGPVDTLHIHLLGDLIEGCKIYPGQRNYLDRANNGDSSVHQVLMMADGLVGSIFKPLREWFRTIVISAADGNHGRTGTKADPSLTKDNLDRLVAEICHRMMSDWKSVVWNLPEGDRYMVNSLGWNIGGIHGHQFGGKSNLNQVELPVLRWDAIQYFGAPLDILNTAHFHNAASLEMQGIEVIRGGAADGGSRWFTETNGSWSPPSQEVYFISKEYGIDSRHRLQLAPRKPRAERYAMPVYS